MAGLHFNKKGTDQKESMLLFVCSESVELPNIVKLETSLTVIFPQRRVFADCSGQRLACCESLCRDH